MKDSTPAFVIIFRLFCLYIIGSMLHQQYIFNIRYGFYRDLDLFLDSPFLSIQICTNIIAPFTLIYCSMKPSRAALTAIRTLFSLLVAYGLISLATSYMLVLEDYGYEEARQIFPPMTIIFQLVEIMFLFVFFVSGSISNWFSRYGLKDQSHERSQ